MAKGETSFGFELANHANRFGLYPVMLRITKDRKKKRVRTSLEVKKADWNQRAKNYRHFRSSCPEASVYNQQLEDILKEYKETYKELQAEGNATQENIVSKVRGGYTSQSFLQYAKEVTQEIYDAGRYRDWKKHNGFINKLEGFLSSISKKDLLFSEVTPALLKKFENYLHTLHNERQPELLLHQNTIAMQFVMFKRILNKAITIDELMKVEDNPFLKYSCSSIKTSKEKLDSTEIDAIKALDLEEGSLIWHCRNYFMFSFYCAGIRAGDLIQLRWGNITDEGRLVYEMGKNHKNRDITLVPQAKEILKYYWKDGCKGVDYIFPLLDPRKEWAKYVSQHEKDMLPPEMKKDLFTCISAKNALINKELAKIATLAGIDKKISMHIARHSFAKIAKDNGLDNLEVKQLLAHSNIATTEKYMGDFSTSRTDSAMAKIFGDEAPAPADALVAQLQSLSPEALAEVLARLGK